MVPILPTLNWELLNAAQWIKLIIWHCQKETLFCPNASFIHLRLFSTVKSLAVTLFFFPLERDQVESMTYLCILKLGLSYHTMFGFKNCLLFNKLLSCSLSESQLLVYENHSTRKRPKHPIQSFKHIMQPKYLLTCELLINEPTLDIITILPKNIRHEKEKTTVNREKKTHNLRKLNNWGRKLDRSLHKLMHVPWKKANCAAESTSNSDAFLQFILYKFCPSAYTSMIVI